MLSEKALKIKTIAKSIDMMVGKLGEGKRQLIAFQR